MNSKFLQSYLRFWAKKYLDRVKPKIIAVTGSVGKTSAKEAIFAVLQVKFGSDVRKSEGNLNNETGMPLAILDYKKAPSYAGHKLDWIPILLSVPFKSMSLAPVKVLVLEMAADAPGDIKYLTGIAKPDIAVLTAIAPAHLEAFGSIEKIIEEKTGVLRALDKDGWAVLNLDDELVRKASYGGWWQKKSYAIGEPADMMAHEISSTIKNFQPKTTFKVSFENQNFNVSQNTLGSVFVWASLAAISVAKILEVSNQDIIKGLADFRLAKHRMNVLEGQNKTIILDDCYNANPVSMRAALDVLKNLPANGGRKITVLGDMREIGKISDEAHLLIGQYAAVVSDLTIGIGKAAKRYNADKYFSDVAKAGEYLLKEIKANDIILVKASRGPSNKPALEPIIEMLKK